MAVTAAAAGKENRMRAIAAKDIVTMYGKPEQGTCIDEVLYGMEMTVLEEAGEYIRVRTDYRYEGYVSRKQVVYGDWQQVWDKLPSEKKEQYFAEEGMKRARVCKGYADLQSAPKVQGICLGSVPGGGAVLAGSTDENGWTAVCLADGRIGFMRSDFLEEYRTCPLPQEQMRRAVTETAKRYLGTQYRWGGKSPLGIDCSGLCSMAYLIQGTVIYRDAQIKEGFPVKEIPYDKKKPGDLLYFPGHIAMYLGEGYYIHSTARRHSDGVVINSLNPDHTLFRQDLADCLYAVGSIF